MPRKNLLAGNGRETQGLKMKAIGQNPSLEQLARLDVLRRESLSEVVIRWDDSLATVSFLSGHWKSTQSRWLSPTNRRQARRLKLSHEARQAVAAAEMFLVQNKGLLRLDDPRRECVLVTYQVDSLGFKHVRFDQYYRGIAVWSASVIVHLTGDNDIYSLSGSYFPTPRSLTRIREKLPAAQAIALALEDLRQTSNVEPIPPAAKEAMKDTGPKAEKVIFHSRDTGQPALAWKIEVRPTVRDRWIYFVDCRAATILFRYNATAS